MTLWRRDHRGHPVSRQDSYAAGPATPQVPTSQRNPPAFAATAADCDLVRSASRSRGVTSRGLSGESGLSLGE